MTKNKISVIELNENKDADMITASIKENRVKHNNPQIDAEFSNTDIFSMKIFHYGIFGKLKNRRAKRFNILIHRSGSNQCVKLAENDLVDPLTNEEASDIVKRTMALGLAKFEPISTKVALLIILLIIINIILTIVLVSKVRFF